MADETKKPKEIKYYMSRSRKHTLAGFRQEQYFPNGKRKCGDLSLQFQNGWLITDDPAKQKFIEASEPFRAGFITVKTEQEFNELQVKNAVRFVKSVAVTETAQAPA